uniref:Uncharacterized protein n=1 Tax=Arundo donax TaxID=35708 RepID=A0A0A9EUM2_ARUDO
MAATCLQHYSYCSTKKKSLEQKKRTKICAKSTHRACKDLKPSIINMISHA